MHSTALQHFMVSEFFWKSLFLDTIIVWKKGSVNSNGDGVFCRPHRCSQLLPVFW